MATAVDRAGVAQLDRPYTKHNRTVAGSPLGALTPQYSGEIVLDTTGGLLYQAQGLTSDTWVQGVRVV